MAKRGAAASGLLAHGEAGETGQGEVWLETARIGNAGLDW